MLDGNVPTGLDEVREAEDKGRTAGCGAGSEALDSPPLPICEAGFGLFEVRLSVHWLRSRRTLKRFT